MRTYQKMYQDAVKTKVVKQLTPTFLKWEKEGQRVIGAFVSSNPVKGKLGLDPYNQYIFETDEGMVKFSMGRNADGEVGGSLARGGVYAITYLGKDRIEGGRSVNRFTVEEIGASDDLPEEVEDEDVLMSEPVVGKRKGK